MKKITLITLGIIFTITYFISCSKKDDNSVGTCTDGIKNQTETGIDCGGPCAVCPTCTDGIKNQGETGIDCGGPCGACATPIAGFNFSGSGVAGPASVAFTNTSTNATSYSWDFGDGSSSTAANPTHIFVYGGNYNVTLTSTGGGGSNSKSKTVSILPGVTECYINFLVLDSISFTNASGNPWDPSDGPDLYFKFTNNGVVIQSGEITGLVPNVMPGNLPAWSVSMPIIPITDTIHIEIWDDDGVIDELIGSVPFTPANFAGQPGSLLLQNGSTKVFVSLSWQ